MKITILTLFPKMISGFFAESIVKRAIDKKLVEIKIISLRDFAVDSYGSVDDRPYGGGAGMVMRVEPIFKALEKVKNQKAKGKTTSEKSKIVLTSPKGKTFTQEKALEFSKLDELVIIAGHYEGVDERVSDFIAEEISLGDFILSGGELAASCITEAVVRLVPGVLKKEEAVKIESFFYVLLDRLIESVGADDNIKKLQKKGSKKIQLLEYPQYTRPEEFMGKKVPATLLSGNHEEIVKWRIRQAYEITLKKRPDLFES